jgi:hypothetical protein
MVRTFGLSVAASMLIAAGLMSVNQAWGAEPAAVVAPAVSPSLARVLAIDQGNAQGAADWKVTPVVAPAGTAGAETLTAPTAQYLTLERKAGISGDCEWIVSYRIPKAVAGSKGPTGGCQVQMSSVASAAKPAQILHFSAGLGAGAPYISYAASVQNPKPPKDAAKPISGYVYTVPVTERSLAWSEEMRRTIEAQMASVPKVEEMVQSLRWVVEGDKYKCWVNGRYIGEFPLEAGMDWSGPVRIMLNPGTELLSVRGRALGEKTGRFEPLSIAGVLNGEGPGPSDKGADPVWQGKATVGGVPFEFPAAGSGPSAKNDHIDVGQSWTRFGAISGYIAGNFGTFGGRWISADRIDPSRICMYVPKGRYKALHLMAVSEDRPDTVPVVTAQFYRPDAGHPINFAGRVPKMESQPSGRESMPITLANGKPGKLHHVVIPLDPDAFSWFSDLPRIGLEITKQVQYYRAYPDPLEYSYHGAGLPSSVKIYAMTLEKAGVDIEINPEKYGHVWTAPEVPGYSIDLKNQTGKATKATVVVSTKSEDGVDHSRQVMTVELPAEATTVAVPVKLDPKRYGLHEVTVSCTAGGESATYKRNMAYFHEDTRDQDIWEEGRGPIFGFWPWQGGHTTPPADKEITIMAAAGAETSTVNYSMSTPEIKALAQKHRFIGESAFTGGVMYYNGFYSWYAQAPKFDPANPAASAEALIKVLKTVKAEPGPMSRPTYVPFFAEPHFGAITTGIWPSHYGEEYKLTTDEQRVFDDMRAKFVTGATAIRKEWPNLKLLLPYGDPMVAAIFLKLAPETRGLVDGVALDLPAFERLPEQQVNQVVLNRLYPILKDIKEYKKDPYLMLIEGTCTSSKDIDTGERGQSDFSIRNFLVLLGYGVDRLESCNAPFDCANYWGENHYGSGWMARLPMAMPKPAYVQYATLTRHVNRANFQKYVTTGSTSTYCQLYKHYRTGKLINVLWTLRGKRVVNVKVAPGTTLSLYDPNDNVTELKEKNGYVTFTIDQSPRYLEGLTAEPEILLGDSDHTDSKPVMAQKLGNFGDGTWAVVEKGDEEYQKNKPLQIERFLGKMTGATVDAPANQGGKALAVHLEKQAKDRGVMPYFTTLEPKSAITIPGKASHLGVWVRASSDWGRVVYSLRDAKGEKWISVGTKEDWNNDDIHGWSNFCFDGWRYVDFELPSSAPYDSYREHGTSWWGSYGGDGVVDLPLRLEKVIVERRDKAVYGNDLVPVKADDVLLGDFFAQYASKADQTEEAVRLSQIRMPVPANAPAMENPIAALAKTGVGAPTKVIRVTDPSHQYDGTRCHVSFEPVAGATAYDVWVAPYKDGTGAMQLGKAWKASGEMITGLRPDREFYVFVTYMDKDGKVSKPSAPLAFTLVDRFGYK